MSVRPYMTRSFELEDELGIRVTVERAGEPVEVQFGATVLMLPPGLAIAVGKSIQDAGKSSLEGKRRQAARDAAREELHEEMRVLPPPRAGEDRGGGRGSEIDGDRMPTPQPGDERSAT
jgi:hypothetical protein